MKRGFRLNYNDIVHIEAGLVNVEGVMLVMPRDFGDRFWGPIVEDDDIVFKTTVKRNEPETVNAALLKIFERVF